jgi:hypothetical protein
MRRTLAAGGLPMLLLIFVVTLLPGLLVELDLDTNGRGPTSKELAERKNSARTTLLQAVGGLVLVVGPSRARGKWKSRHSR